VGLDYRGYCYRGELRYGADRVKLAEISYSTRQIERIRARLGDNSSPVHLIQRPRYQSGRLMDKKRFEALIIRLKKHENRVAQCIEQDALRWFRRTY
jgi:hypothetical protein